MAWAYSRKALKSHQSCGSSHSNEVPCSMLDWSSFLWLLYCYYTTCFSHGRAMFLMDCRIFLILCFCSYDLFLLISVLGIRSVALSVKCLARAGLNRDWQDRFLINRVTKKSSQTGRGMVEGLLWECKRKTGELRFKSLVWRSWGYQKWILELEATSV